MYEHFIYQLRKMHRLKKVVTNISNMNHYYHKKLTTIMPDGKDINIDLVNNSIHIPNECDFTCNNLLFEYNINNIYDEPILRTRIKLYKENISNEGWIAKCINGNLVWMHPKIIVDENNPMTLQIISIMFTPMKI